MYYKSDGKFVIKCFIGYLKIKLLNYVKVTRVPYYVLLLLHEKKNDVLSYESFISYFKNSMKTIENYLSKLAYT